MLRPLGDNSFKQHVPTFRRLEVTLLESHAFSFETKLLHLMGQLTLWAAKYLQEVQPAGRLGLFGIGLDDRIQFFSVLFYQTNKPTTFLACVVFKTFSMIHTGTWVSGS